MSVAPVLEASHVREFVLVEGQVARAQTLVELALGLENEQLRALSIGAIAAAPSVILWGASGGEAITLDEQQQKLLNDLSFGLTGAMIARQNKIGVGAEESRITKLYRVLGVSNNVQAVTLGMCLGFLQPRPKQTYENRWLEDEELELYRYVALGLTDEEVAESLDVTPSTVRYWLKKVHPLLGAQNKPHASRILFELGMFQVKPPGIDLKPKG